MTAGIHRRVFFFSGLQIARYYAIMIFQAIGHWTEQEDRKCFGGIFLRKRYGSAAEITIIAARCWDLSAWETHIRQTVTVEEKEGTFYTATCDCPHSRSGFYCKHVAAVLFAVDEYEDSHADREVENNPFDALYESQTGDDDSYRYFDMRRMTRNILIYEETYNRALALLKSGQVTDVSLKYGCRNGIDGTACEAQGIYKNNYDCLLTATFDRDKLLGSMCEKYVAGFGVTGTIKQGDKIVPNQYILALMLQAGKMIDDIRILMPAS